MQIFDYLIRASNAASLFQSEKEDLHDIVLLYQIPIVKNS